LNPKYCCFFVFVSVGMALPRQDEAIVADTYV